MTFLENSLGSYYRMEGLKKYYEAANGFKLENLNEHMNQNWTLRWLMHYFSDFDWHG